MPNAFQFMRALQDNFVSVWPEDAYARDVTHVRIGLRHMFTANAPEHVRHVLLDNAANYRKTPIVRRLFAPALGEGLLTSEGAVWKRHRQMMAPIFVQRRMAALVPIMAEAARAHLDGWKAQAGAAFDLTASLSAITLDIITRTMFGAENYAETATIAGDSAAYQSALRPSLLDFLGAPAWVPRPGTRTAMAIGDRLTDMIGRVVARRRASIEPRDDLLALLLQAVDRNEVSLKEIRDEIATVFVAGHETTAATLGWVLYLLDRHPVIAQRLRDELRAVLNGRAPAAEDLDRLVFIRRVAEEALRLYPPAHTVTRIAIGNDRLGEVAVPKGAVVVVSPWLVHRNPKLWRDPELFDPDRFDPADAANERSRYSYIPFGAGPRICIGASFAMTEIVVVMATMLQDWQIRMTPGHKVEPLALIAMRPRWGLKATAEPICGKEAA